MTFLYVFIAFAAGFVLWIIFGYIAMFFEDTGGKPRKMKRWIKAEFDHPKRREFMRKEIIYAHFTMESDALDEEIAKRIDRLKFKNIKDEDVPRLALEIAFSSALSAIWTTGYTRALYFVADRSYYSLFEMLCGKDGEATDEWREKYKELQKVLDFTKTKDFGEVQEYILSEKDAFER